MKNIITRLFIVSVLTVFSAVSTWATDFSFSLNSLYQNGNLVTGKTIISTSGGTLTFTDVNEHFTILLTRNSGNQPGFYTSSGYFRFYTSDTFKLTAANGITMTKVVISPNGSNFNLATLSGLNTSTKTWEGSASEITFTGSGTNKWDSLTITYSSGPSKTATTVTIDASDLTNTDLYLGTTAGSLNATVKDNNNTTVEGASVTWTSSATNVATVASNGSVTLVSVGSTTITASYAGNSTYESSSANYELTVTDTTPGFTVTLGDDSSKLTEVSPGAGVTLPSRDDLNGYAFVGWSTTNVSEKTPTAPTIISAGAYSPEADITLYPVYSKAVGGGSSTNQNVSVDIQTYAANNNWENAIAYQPLNMNSNISIGGTISGNNFKYYSSDDSWRFYTNGSFTIIANNNTSLSSVTLTFTGGLSYNDSAIKSDEAFGVSGSSATIHCTANAKITAISVSYTVTDAGTTYYWSSPVAAAVEVPEITVAENPFLFSTTATITCATEGAAIKYSYDGENWSDYTTALTITETKTIFAKGVKDNDESDIVSVTATKNLAEPTVIVSGDLEVDLANGTDVNAGTLTASVTYDNTPINGATVSWSSSNNAIATISTEGDVTIKAKGEVTFTATYAGNSDYAEATDNKVITVINSFDPGQKNNPYSVAEAIQNTPSSGTSANVYIHGIVSALQSETIIGDNSNRYYISDDGTISNQLLVYRGKGLNNVAFANANDLLVGDIVTIYGGLTTYNSTKEIASGNYLVSWERPAVVPVIQAADVNIACDAVEGTIEYTIHNPVDGGSLTASKEASWIRLDDDPGTVGVYEFECDANTLPASRTATITLTYTYNTNETVTKDVIITQAAYVAASATIGDWVLTNLADLTEDDVFVIVGDNGDTYALSSSNGTSGAPAASSITIKENIIDETKTPVTDALKFNIGGNATDGYVFFPNGSTSSYIYTTDTNNGVRVGKPNSNTTEIHAFTITDGYLTAGFETARYLGIYNSQDWRTYTSKTSGNIAGQSFSFYKFTIELTLNIDEANITSTSAMVSWNSGSKASYTVQLDDEDTFETPISSNTVSGNSYIFKDLTPGKTYYARVDGSTPISFTTLANDAVSIDRSGVPFEGRYWTTFYKSNKSYKLENGVQAFTMHSDNKLYLLGENGRVIPAGTAVIIIADKASITLTECTSSISDNDNILEGSDEDVNLNGGKVDGKVPHVLSIQGNPAAIGFYKFTGGSIPAGKAYVLVGE